MQKNPAKATVSFSFFKSFFKKFTSGTASGTSVLKRAFA